MYLDGSYLKKHPTWHVEDSLWKAKQIIRMMERNNIAPGTICEVGCGTGEILNQLQRMNTKCIYWGYEISPQAFELAKSRANERLQFKLGDFLQEEDVFFDLILLIDVIEHLEDYFGFLRGVRSKSRHKILHIPLDLSVQHVLRVNPIVEKWEVAGHIHFFTEGDSPSCSEGCWL